MKPFLAILTTLLCIQISACGGGGSSGGNSTPPPPPPVNRAPVVTSASDVIIQENASGTVYDAVATDADNDQLTFSLTGTDSNLFTINQASGSIAFVSSPDFEAPSDSDQNNVYEFDVEVSDGQLSATIGVRIEVENQLETAVRISKIFDPGSVIDTIVANGDINLDGKSEIALSSPIAELADGSPVTPIPTSDPISKVAILDANAINALDGQVADFAMIPSANIFKIVGPAGSAGDFEMDLGGDADGDGRADLLLGLPITSIYDGRIGTAFFVPGQAIADQMGNDVLLENIPDIGGLAFTSDIDRGSVGLSVKFLRDFNGMGRDDFVVGDDGIFNGGSMGTQYPGGTVIYGEAINEFLDVTEMSNVANNGQGVSYRNEPGSYLPSNSFAAFDDRSNPIVVAGVPPLGLGLNVLGAVYAIQPDSASRAVNGVLDFQDALGSGTGSRLVNTKPGTIGAAVFSFSDFLGDQEDYFGTYYTERQFIDDRLDGGDIFYIVKLDSLIEDSDSSAGIDEIGGPNIVGYSIESTAQYQFTESIDLLSNLSGPGDNFLLLGMNGTVGGIYLLPVGVLVSDDDGVISFPDLIASDRVLEIDLGPLDGLPVIASTGDVSGDGIDDLVIAAKKTGDTQTSVYFISGAYAGQRWAAGARSLLVDDVLRN